MTFSKKNTIMQSIMSAKKVLILRLSSFGDIIQTLPCIDLLAQQGYCVHFVTKKSFTAPLLAHDKIDKLHIFETQNTSLLKELKRINSLIASEQYDYIYDAHNNLRATFMLWFSFLLRLRLRVFKGKAKTFRRTKSRWKRFLLFRFRLDTFPLPFVSADSFIAPLIKAQILNADQSAKQVSTNLSYNSNIEKASSFVAPDSYICLAPSAAWPLKRWPIAHFQKLMDLMPDHQFVIIGGPEDTFTQKLQSPNLTHLVGKLSWADTGKILKKAQLVLSADTGVLHWADYMGVPSLGLLGPTAFGVPFRDSSTALSLNLPCSPCTKDGRGKCKIKETKKCLVDLNPIMIRQEILNRL